MLEINDVVLYCNIFEYMGKCEIMVGRCDVSLIKGDDFGRHEMSIL